jgi:predicted acylesterase/phospholipase RssA
MNKRIDIPEKERALVHQGGGSLGAYSAGVYRGFYESLSRMDADEGNKGKPIFDISAGTSIGAINAAILVSYVVENQTYEGEAARRYYSAKEFSVFGVPTVFYPHGPKLDNKYFDFDNVWYRYSIEPLKRSLERFAKFPIATIKEDGQPRLLLVAVDVADGIQVTFDSYPKEDGTRKTEYGRFLTHNGKGIGFEHVVHYDKGITLDHVIASGSFQSILILLI